MSQNIYLSLPMPIQIADKCISCQLKTYRHKKFLFWNDGDMHSIVAIYNVTPGTATGRTGIWAYKIADDALRNAQIPQLTENIYEITRNVLKLSAAENISTIKGSKQNSRRQYKI